MAYASAVYTGNGSTTQFAIPCPYIRKEHIKVYVNYIDTAYTYVGTTIIQLATAPAASLRVEVRRITPLNAPLVDYADGSTLIAVDLDTSNLQSLYNAQELDDSQQNVDASIALKVAKAGDSMTGALAMGTNKITGLGTPTASTDAVTKAYVDATVSAGVADGDKGDITVSGNGTSYVIDNGAVTTAKISNSAVTTEKTTATSSNIANLIVTRDSSGNFSANTITASLIGTASGNHTLTRGTAINTTSGTSIDFTGIPSNTKRITVMLVSVSTNGSDNIIIQLGDSGGIEAFGYTQSLTYITSGGAVGREFVATGFALGGFTPTFSMSGAIVFTNINANYWIGTGSTDGATGGLTAGYTQGFKQLSAVLDRIRITTRVGTDVFDAGFANVLLEG